MKNIFLIANKEIKTYIASPMAYIVAASFLAVTGFFFVASVSDAFAEASIRGFLAGAVFFPEGSIIKFSLGISGMLL